MTSEKWITFLYLISGILAGLQFLIPPSWHNKTEAWLINILNLQNDSERPLPKKLVFVVSILSIVFILAIAVWGVNQYLSKKILPVNQIWTNTLLILLSYVIGMVFYVLLVWLLSIVLHIGGNKIRSTIYPIITIISSILLLIVMLLLPDYRILGIGFSFGIIVIALMMLAVPYGFKYLTLGGGILARLALVIFIAASFWQLSI